MDDDQNYRLAIVESLQISGGAEETYHAFKDEQHITDVHKFEILFREISETVKIETLMKNLPDVFPQIRTSDIPAIPTSVVTLMTDLVHRIVQAGDQAALQWRYRRVRSSILKDDLSRLGVREFSRIDVNNTKWRIVKIQVQNWTKCIWIAVKVLFARERVAYNQIFKGFDPSMMIECFVKVTSERVDELVSFGEAICKSNPTCIPMKLIYLLDMYKVMTEVRPGIKTAFKGPTCKKLRDNFIALEAKLAKAAREAFPDFVLAAKRANNRAAFVDVMNVFNYESTLGKACKVFEKQDVSEARVAEFMKKVIKALLNSLGGKSKQYADLLEVVKQHERKYTS